VLCASFTDPDNLINGNAMNASSKTNALNIVADMLRKLNVSPQLKKKRYIPSMIQLSIYQFMFPRFFCFVCVSFSSYCFCSYVFSGTRPCYVLNVKSFVAFVSVQCCRRRPAILVSFVAPLAAAVPQTSLAPLAPLRQRPAAMSAGQQTAMLKCNSVAAV